MLQLSVPVLQQYNFQIETVSLLLDAPEVIGDVCEVLGEISLYIVFFSHNVVIVVYVMRAGGPYTPNILLQHNFILNLK